MASSCKACGTRTTASAGYCQSCKSKRHHGYKRLKEENLLLDEAGGAWWIWDQRGDVVVIGKPTREAAIIALGGGEDDVDDDVPDVPVPQEHHAMKKTAAQLDREIAAALAGPKDTDNDEGLFYVTDTHEHPLGPEFSSRAAAKRAAMKLVREGVHPRVEVWHRWRGDRYMQGLASEDGWSDV